MKLTKKAVKAASAHEVRLKLAIALNFSEQWINKVLDANKDNGPLTTMAAIQVIKDNTRLSDGEILEEAKKAVA